MKTAVRNYLKTGTIPQHPTDGFWLAVGKAEYTPVGLYRLARHQLRSRGIFSSVSEKNKCVNISTGAPFKIANYLLKNPDAAVPKKRPKYAGCNVEMGHYLLLAITFSCHSQIGRKEIDFLTGGERGYVRTTDWIDPYGSQPNTVKSPKYLTEFAQKNYSIEEEARDLAEAFETSMLAKAAVIKRPPLIGAYRMQPPLFPMLVNFRPGEFRLIVKADHVWWSHIDEVGDCTVAYWSPKTDNLDFILPPKFSWPIRIFLACLWYDLKHTETQIIKRFAPSNRNEWKNKPKIKTVVLPRKIWDLRWGHENSKAMYEKYAENGRFEKRKSPRVHYRRLQEGWQASEDARDNATAWGQPDPPEGWTFVSPKGVAPQDIPKLISTGLDVAHVVLASLI